MSWMSCQSSWFAFPDLSCSFQKSQSSKSRDFNSHVSTFWVNLTGIFSKGPTIPKIGFFQITEIIYNNLISTKPTDFYGLLFTFVVMVGFHHQITKKNNYYILLISLGQPIIAHHPKPSSCPLEESEIIRLEAQNLLIDAMKSFDSNVFRRDEWVFNSSLKIGTHTYVYIYICVCTVYIYNDSMMFIFIGS